jgi:hypothetical protein
MRKGFYEKPGLRYGWAIINSGGYLCGDVRSSRPEAIREFMKGWPPDWTWKKLRRKYGMALVWVKMEVI